MTFLFTIYTFYKAKFCVKLSILNLLDRYLVLTMLLDVLFKHSASKVATQASAVIRQIVQKC